MILIISFCVCFSGFENGYTILWLDDSLMVLLCQIHYVSLHYVLPRISFICKYSMNFMNLFVTVGFYFYFQCITMSAGPASL